MRGEEPGVDDERAGTRWVFAVPAGLLTLVAGFFCRALSRACGGGSGVELRCRVLN